MRGGGGGGGRRDGLSTVEGDIIPKTKNESNKIMRRYKKPRCKGRSKIERCETLCFDYGVAEIKLTSAQKNVEFSILSSE